MPLQKYRWSIHAPVPEDIQKELGEFSPLLQQLLYNRKITTHRQAQSFIDALEPENVRDTQLLGVEKAVNLILNAFEEQKKIAVYGDFDADGITGTALVTSALRSLQADVITYIPHRVEEGYGLNREALHDLQQQGVNLIITVDCGIRAVEETRYAKKMGLDIIVTDHHQPGQSLPDADAIINPNHPQDPYSNKDLAGVGVAYKLISALLDNFPEQTPATEYLDLVALGTIADLVPLLGENRYLARQGLRQLRQPHRQGLLSLMGVAGISPHSIRASDISFQIAPRLNAAGRLETANYALELLLEDKVHRAGRLAQEIEILNNRRKKLMGKVRSTAEEIAVTDKEIPPILFAFHPDFNLGVVGLAAGHLADKYHRPAIVGKQKKDLTIASCRSIEEFNIIKALDQHQDLFLQYGGHPSAAGFSIKTEGLQDLIEHLTSYSYHALQDIDLVPKIKADLEIDFSSLGYRLLDEIQLLSPMGHGNPQPHFVTRGVGIKSSRAVGTDKGHLKLDITDGDHTFDAIAFGWGPQHTNLPSRVDILYTFEKNEFRGNTTLQLNIKDFRGAS